MIALGVASLALAAVGAAVSAALATREARRYLLHRAWRRAEVEHLEMLHEQALAEDAVTTAVVELEQRVHRYRHNIHCPTCGRFSRQAEGWPEGVADCGLHGIGLRTLPHTGSIPIVVTEIPDHEVLAVEVVPDEPVFELTLTEAPDPLAELLEEALA